MTKILEPVLEKLDSTTDDSLQRLFQLLKIPSISTDPDNHHKDCVLAAEYCIQLLKEIGFETHLYETKGEPIVVGHYTPKVSTSGPHVLFYGHYDVQPEDPVDLWDTPAFSPQILEDEIHGKVIAGRGSSDDKGQLMTFLEACRSWKSVHGDLPLRITVLFEGEEESGSPSLPNFFAAHKDEIKADIALVCDTSQWDVDTPAITTMLRGLAYTELTITGPDRDLHSGHYGGVVMNPIRALTNILGDLYDDEGRIQIPNFYDDVVLPDEEQLQQWKHINFSSQDFLGSVGLSQPAGEINFSPLEQLWSRPSIEINGIQGGYTGPGSKTVIPESAFAKVSFRLVANQNPDEVLENFKLFVRERLPKDCKVEFKGNHASPAVKFETSTKYMQSASQALSDEFSKPALLIGCGASIPIVESFKTELGMETLLIGFALDDDRIHSPNEKYNLSSFNRGKRSWARILNAISQIES